MVTSLHTRIRWYRKKLLLTLFLAFVVVPLHGRDFAYEYAGKTLIYTVLDENKKTCKTKAGNLKNVPGKSVPGNNVEGDVVIPAIVKDGETEYTVVSIGSSGFCNCSGLTSIEIPTSITSIESYAFNGCSGLISIVIPPSVTDMGYYIFDGCKEVKKSVCPSKFTLRCIVPGTRILYDADGAIMEQGVIYGKDKSAIYFVPLKYEGEFTIPCTVTSIGDKAFADCANLTGVNIPNSVSVIGEWAFRNCSKLTSVEIPNSVTSIGGYAFGGCSMLESVKIPNSITSIEESVFSYCSKLTSVEIPKSVTTIGPNAFYYCPNLTSIIIPNSVTSIGSEAFMYCRGLKYATIEGSPVLNKSVFAGCKLCPLKIKGDYDSYNATGLEGLLTDSYIVCKTKDVKIIKSKFTGDVFSYEEPFIINKSSVISLICGVKFIPGNNPYYEGPDVALTPTVDIVEHKIGEEVKVAQNIKLDVGKQNIISGLKFSTNYSLIPSWTLEDDWNNHNYFKTLTPAVNCDYSATQISITVKSVTADKDESITPKIYIKTTNGDKLYNGGDYTVKGLLPNQQQSIVYADYNGSKINAYGLWTTAVSVSASAEASPTTVKLLGSYAAGGAKIKSFAWYEDGSKTIKVADTKDATISGLVPGSTHQFHLTINGQASWTASSTKIKVTLPSVKFKMLQPKCVSDSKAIIAAETNISDLESNIGFQWKKYGAPESLDPKEGYAVVRDGVIEGYISNLQSTLYYNVRAFFKDVEGKYYYSDWITFDPSDFSFFEPTVRTYSTEIVGDNHATLRGYVLPGTDDIVRQGFQYWVNPKAISRADAPEIFTVEAKGQMMTAEISNLKPGCEYIFRAFVETKSGFTYGEEQSFQTSGASGLEDTFINNSEPEIVGYYDVFGHRYDKPCHGVNIVLYSDGTTKKIYIK